MAIHDETNVAREIRAVTNEVAIRAVGIDPRKQRELRARAGGALLSTVRLARRLASACSNKNPKNALAPKNAASSKSVKPAVTR